MKKFYTLVAATAIVFSATAQKASISAPAGKVVVNNQLRASQDAHARFHSADRSGGPVWMNFGQDLNDPSGFSPGMADLNFMNLFPDSTITLGLDASSNPVSTWSHKAGVYCDPRFNPLNPFGMTDNYMMDSLAIEYAYLRNTTETDTLRIQVIAQNASNNYALTGPPAVFYQDITYDYTSNDLSYGGTYGMTVLKTINIPLTDADSSSTNTVMAMAVSGIPVQTGGKIIGVVLSFIPGYTWSQSDIVSTDKNAFYLVTLEQNGASTAQDYYGNGTSAAGDMNMSYILNQDIRYNINANGWNGYFLPSLAFTDPYGFENHSVYFHLDNTTGVGVNEVAEGVNVGQNVPNPFSSTSTIGYELEKEAAVSISVYDVTGKKVAGQSQGTQSAGKHSISFDGSSLAAGVYYYSLTVGEKATSTMKMVIVK